MSTIEVVIRIIKQILNLDDSVNEFNSSTLLLGDIPEIDSMSIVNIIGALEENFDIEINDDDITAEVFESVGTLVDFIEHKLAEQ